jgi:hypothetical protein
MEEKKLLRCENPDAFLRQVQKMVRTHFLRQLQISLMSLFCSSIIAIIKSRKSKIGEFAKEQKKQNIALYAQSLRNFYVNFHLHMQQHCKKKV